MQLWHISNRKRIPQFSPESTVNSSIVKDWAVYIMAKGWADGHMKDPGTRMNIIKNG